MAFSTTSSAEKGARQRRGACTLWAGRRICGAKETPGRVAATGGVGASVLRRRRHCLRGLYIDVPAEFAGSFANSGLSQ